jgi:tRNA 2-thiouridine synthesizing protein A
MAAQSTPAGRPKVDALVDARGLSCPMPLVKARQALMVLAGGARICVLATDPAAPRDFEDFTDATGHTLLEVREEDGVFVILLAKSG